MINKKLIFVFVLLLSCSFALAQYSSCPNTGGDWVIKAKYFQAQSFTEGLAAVREFSKWGYINKNGEWIILPQFDQAAPFEEGLASVVDNGRWGFIDDRGVFIIITEYEKASYIYEGLAVVANKNHNIYIKHQIKNTLIKNYSTISRD